MIGTVNTSSDLSHTLKAHLRGHRSRAVLKRPIVYYTMCTVQMLVISLLKPDFDSRIGHHVT